MNEIEKEFNEAEKEFIDEMRRALNQAKAEGRAEGYGQGYKIGYKQGQLEKHDYSPVISELDPTVKEELDRLVRNNEFRYGKEL